MFVPNLKLYKMNNETLAVLENCKDYLEEVKNDKLATHLLKEINNLIKIETT